MKGSVIVILVAAAFAARAHAQETPHDPIAPPNFGLGGRAITVPDEVLSRTIPATRPRDPTPVNLEASPSDIIKNTNATEQNASPSLDTTAPPPASLFAPPSVKTAPLFGGAGTNFILNAPMR